MCLTQASEDVTVVFQMQSGLQSDVPAPPSCLHATFVSFVGSAVHSAVCSHATNLVHKDIAGCLEQS